MKKRLRQQVLKDIITLQNTLRSKFQNGWKDNSDGAQTIERRLKLGDGYVPVCSFKHDSGFRFSITVKNIYLHAGYTFCSFLSTPFKSYHKTITCNSIEEYLSQFPEIKAYLSLNLKDYMQDMLSKVKNVPDEDRAYTLRWVQELIRETSEFKKIWDAI